MLEEAPKWNVDSSKDPYSDFTSLVRIVKNSSPKPGKAVPNQAQEQEPGYLAIREACNRSFGLVTAADEWNKLAVPTRSLLVSLAHLTYGRLKAVKARRYIPYDLWHLWIVSLLLWSHLPSLMISELSIPQRRSFCE
jgi:hypothetical protein